MLQHDLHQNNRCLNLQWNPRDLSEKSEVLTMAFRDPCDLLTISPFPLRPHLLPPSLLLIPLQPTCPSCFSSDLPWRHAPACSSTQHPLAHPFTSLMAFLKCHLLHEVITGHPTEHCSCCPHTPYLPFLLYFIR